MLACLTANEPTQLRRKVFSCRGFQVLKVLQDKTNGTLWYTTNFHHHTMVRNLEQNCKSVLGNRGHHAAASQSKSSNE